MSTTFPTALDGSSPVNGNTDELFSAATVAVETKVGRSSASAADTPAANTVLYSDATGRSKWSGSPTVSGTATANALAATTSVTGATVVGSTSVTGAAVVGTNSVTTKEYIGTTQALATSGTISVDPTAGNIITITPSNACTFNAATAPKCRVVFVVTTSGTSAFVLTFGSNFKSTGTLSTGTADAKVFTVSFQGDGTNLNEVSRTTAM